MHAEPRGLILAIAASLACAHDAEPLPCADTEACGSSSDSGTASTGGPTDASGPDDTSAPDSTSTASDDDGTSAASSSSDSTTGPGPCMDDAACAMLDPDFPLCVDEACVQCSERDATQCTGATPICDLATHACIPCTAHEQCPDSACDMADGSCFSPEVLVHVDGDAGGCAAADGSETDPFCTFADALAGVGPGARAALRVAATAAPYGETFAITADRIVAIVAWGDASPVLDPLAAGSTITVDGATIYLDRMRLEGNTASPAIALDGAVAWVDRTVLALNPGGGIAATTSSELHLRNTVIGAGGTGLADRYAIHVDDSTFDVLDSTIAGNDGTGLASLRCIGGATGTVRNSIVVGVETPSIQCPGIEVATSAIDTEALGGADVVVLDDFVAGWFVDAPGGDFHLVPDTQFEDLGVWEQGDPVVDLDGDARPTRDGAVDVVGADVP